MLILVTLANNWHGCVYLNQVMDLDLEVISMAILILMVAFPYLQYLMMLQHLLMGMLLSL